MSNHELGPAVIRPNNGGGVFNMQNAGNGVFSGVFPGNYFNKALKNVVYCSVLIALPRYVYIVGIVRVKVEVFSEFILENRNILDTTGFEP